MSTGDDARPGLAEALAVWSSLAVLCALAWITYARLPARDFYNVTGTGVRAGASRVLVLLGWPISIIAVALLAVAVDRLLADDSLGRGGRRLVVACAWVSFGLCLTIAWPGVVNQDDLDAKPSNALAAIGVGLAFALTLWALAHGGVGRSPGRVVGTALPLHWWRYSSWPGSRGSSRTSASMSATCPDCARSSCRRRSSPRKATRTYTPFISATMRGSTAS